jgi:short-subunit dehydrogenase
MSSEEIFGQIQLNIIALTELTRLFLPPMLVDISTASART